MTVEIRRPEPEALIQAGTRLGALDSVGGARLPVLRTAPLPPVGAPPKKAASEAELTGWADKASDPVLAELLIRVIALNLSRTPMRRIAALSSFG
jgi:hypothetical protein